MGFLAFLILIGLLASFVVGIFLLLVGISRYRKTITKGKKRTKWMLTTGIILIGISVCALLCVTAVVLSFDFEEKSLPSPLAVDLSDAGRFEMEITAPASELLIPHVVIQDGQGEQRPKTDKLDKCFPERLAFLLRIKDSNDKTLFVHEFHNSDLWWGNWVPKGSTDSVLVLDLPEGKHFPRVKAGQRYTIVFKVLAGAPHFLNSKAELRLVFRTK